MRHRSPTGRRVRSAVVSLLAVAATVAAAVTAALTLPRRAGAHVPPARPNELGRVPILEYHLVGDRESRWSRERGNFRRDLELLYRSGYRPITVAELVSRSFDLPAGTSPVVFTFDDASPGQFSYVRRAGGTLVPDPQSAIGIWLDFAKAHPDWGTKATFCVLSNATHGHAFFGDRGIGGQETAWRFPKLQFLVRKGFELCNHTLWHGTLNRLSDDEVRAQIGRAQAAIDSAVPGYRVRTFALPLGLWPRNRGLARTGAWTDRASGRAMVWAHDAILEVADTKAAGPVSFSPHDPRFDPLSLPRVQVVGKTLEALLDRLERTGQRYVSDGDPRTVAKPGP